MPEGTDANGNGFPDFFEISSAVSGLTTTGTFFDDFGEEGGVTARWTRDAGGRMRDAGGRTGTCALTLSGAAFGDDLEVSVSFELIEYAGELEYQTGETEVQCPPKREQRHHSVVTISSFPQGNLDRLQK